MNIATITAAIEIPAIGPSDKDVELASCELCCVLEEFAVDEGTTAISELTKLVDMVGIDDMLLGMMLAVLAKLKPLTGMAKTEAVDVITTVAVKALASAWLLRYENVCPMLMVDRHWDGKMPPRLG